MRIANDDLIEAGTLTDMSVNIISVPIWLGHIVNYSIQLEFTGSPVGTFKLQYSDDEGNPSLPPPTQYEGVSNFTDVAGSSQAITAAGNHMWDVANCGSCWVRFVYTKGSSTGTLTGARFNVKGA